jgi:glycosyltransferase involved in cell wall biosynthesis
MTPTDPSPIPYTWPMRVARVIAKLEPGGAQFAAFRLSDGLRPHGIESVLFAGESTPLGVEVAREHGYEVECMLDHLAGLQWTPSGAFAEWLAPRMEGFDLVHGHMFGAWWALAQVAPPGAPLVASEHNALAWPGAPRHREVRDALRRVDLVYAHGPAAHAYVRALGARPGQLVLGRSAIGGTHCDPMPGLPSPRIVATMRMARDKGPDVLVEALARLRDAPPAFLLGDGELLEPLRRRVRELGIEGRVTLTGWQRDPGRWVNGASVFVQPSREEAWSQSVALAMALGTPVVGTDVEGLPRLLGDGRGLMVAPEDPDALAAAIGDVLSGRRRPDVDAAKAYANAFTPERLGREVAGRYEALVRAGERWTTFVQVSSSSSSGP